MTRDELVTQLRTLLCDTQSVGFPLDSELLEYLDRAAMVYSEQMIAAKDPTMRKTSPIVGTMDVPDDFVALVGNQPVFIVGNTMEYYGSTPHELVYFGHLELPSTLGADEVIPYADGAPSIILQMAHAYALNRNEYDISQDLTLIEGWSTAMKGARS